MPIKHKAEMSEHGDWAISFQWISSQSTSYRMERNRLDANIIRLLGTKLAIRD